MTPLSLMSFSFWRWLVVSCAFALLLLWENSKRLAIPTYLNLDKPQELNSTAPDTDDNKPIATDSNDGVLVVIKTGNTELFKALPIHLLTTVQGHRHMIFSDHEQVLSNFIVQDALDTVQDVTMKGNKDFDLYRRQKEMIRSSQSPEHLKLEGGWDLDKYKNIHMMTKSFQQAPDMKWYVYIDADTYVALVNLIPYLEGLDHTQRLYIGSGPSMGMISFGHGGTGYVISHGAMKHVLETTPNMAHKYEKQARETCCGDYVIAEVMKDHNITLTDVWPHMQGRAIHEMEFHTEMMCAPIFTSHHMLSSEVNMLWNYEQQVKAEGRPLLFQDIYKHFIFPSMKAGGVKAWDNYADGEEVKLTKEMVADAANLTATMPTAPANHELATDNEFLACEQECVKRPTCYQFRMEKEKCWLHTKGIRLGRPTPVKWADRDRWRSGWNGKKMEEMEKVRCERPKYMAKGKAHMDELRRVAAGNRTEWLEG